MLYECIGNVANNPYYIEEDGIRIFTIEELCHYFVVNTLALEKSIMKQGLCFFIEKELGLYNLGRELLGIVNQNIGLAAFVVKILEYCHFCSREELYRIEKVLGENDSLEDGMRFFLRGNIYSNTEQFYKAIREYVKALEYTDKKRNQGLYADIYFNLGCCYARLFMYDVAAGCFTEVCNTAGDDEAYFMYLSCLRLSKSRKDYTNMVNECSLDKDAVMQLEDRIVEITDEYRQGEDLKLDKLRMAYDEFQSGNDSTFSAECERWLEKWKEEYRTNIS